MTHMAHAIYMHTYVCMYVCMCACMYVCIYVCMYVCMCIYIYKQPYLQTPKTFGHNARRFNTALPGP